MTDTLSLDPERISECARGLMFADFALRKEPDDPDVQYAVLARLVLVRDTLNEIIIGRIGNTTPATS